MESSGGDFCLFSKGGSRHAQYRIRMAVHRHRLSGFGIGESETEGGRIKKKRKASNVIKYPQRIVLDGDSHLQLQDIAANSAPEVALNEHENKKLVSFLLAADIYDSVEVLNNVEQPAVVFMPADNRVAVVGMHGGAFHGVPQCTMEKSLPEMDRADRTVQS